LARTEAQEAAIDRDIELFGDLYCVWHRFRPKGKALIRGTEGHHIAKRRNSGGDVPELIVLLCHECHMHFHNGKEPTSGQLLWLMKKVYGYDLRAMFPSFFKTPTDNREETGIVG